MWKAAAHTKQEELWQDIPSEWRIDRSELSKAGPNVINIVPEFLSPAERRITEMPVCLLLESLAQGDITAQETLFAFAHRALVAHQFVRRLVPPLRPSLRDFDADMQD